MRGAETVSIGVPAAVALSGVRDLVPLRLLSLRGLARFVSCQSIEEVVEALVSDVFPTLEFERIPVRALPAAVALAVAAVPKRFRSPAPRSEARPEEGKKEEPDPFWLQRMIDLFASEYGWTKDEILGLDAAEAFIFSDCITARHGDSNFEKVRLASIPQMKGQAYRAMLNQFERMSKALDPALHMTAEEQWGPEIAARMAASRKRSIAARERRKKGIADGDDPEERRDGRHPSRPVVKF